MESSQPVTWAYGTQKGRQRARKPCFDLWGGAGEIGKFMKQNKAQNQLCWLTTHEDW